MLTIASPFFVGNYLFQLFCKGSGALLGSTENTFQVHFISYFVYVFVNVAVLSGRTFPKSSSQHFVSSLSCYCLDPSDLHICLLSAGRCVPNIWLCSPGKYMLIFCILDETTSLFIWLSLCSFILFILFILFIIFCLSLAHFSRNTL